MAFQTKNLIKVLLERTRVPLTTIDIDVEDATSYTVVVNDALSKAMAFLNIDVTDMFSVSDADLVTLTNDDVADIIDLAEYRILVTCLNNMNTTDERLGPHGKWESQYPDRIRKRIEHMEKTNSSLLEGVSGGLTFGIIEYTNLYAE